MSLDRFFTKTITHQRKASETGDPNEAWANMTPASIKCSPIFPINPGDSIAFQNIYLSLKITHSNFCWATEGVAIDDQMVDGTDKYIIKKINKWGNFYQIYYSEVA